MEIKDVFPAQNVLHIPSGYRGYVVSIISMEEVKVQFKYEVQIVHPAELKPIAYMNWRAKNDYQRKHR